MHSYRAGLLALLSFSFSPVTLARLHFILQLEIQACIVNLPTPRYISCIFTALRYAKRGMYYANSVRPYVCLSACHMRDLYQNG